MPFHVIRGTFHVTGYSPDGDSLRFQALDGQNWDLLDGPRVNLNARQHAQLRLEAIDTLETHYQGDHQPTALAHAARDALLSMLGITNIVWNAAETKVLSANDGTDGYIVSRIVEPNRRPVSFVFAGVPAEADGSQLYFDANRLRQSVNFQLLEQGLAYPTYYKGLFPDLRQACTAAMQHARQQQLGVWPVDRTQSGVDVTSLDVITDHEVILPKLFRRLAEYLRGGGTVHGFLPWLETRQEGVLVISPQVHPTHFDTVIDVTGSVVRMTEPPENLIFEG